MHAAGAWRARLLVAAVLAAGVVPIAAAPAGAETYVNVTNGGDAGAGSLRAAVAIANAAADDVVIQVPMSVTLTTGAVAYSGGVGGAHSLRIEGAGDTITQTQNGSRILTSTTTGTVRIERLTLTGGRSGGTCGGAVSATGPLELDHLTLTGNASTCGGGGAFAPTITATDSVISGNSGNVVGGGLYAPGGTVTLVRSTVSGNTAQFGGGVLASDFVADRSTLEGNQASVLGGGAYVEQASLTNSTVSGNAGGNAGGGIAGETESSGGGAIELVYSTVVGNTATVSTNLSGGTLRSFASAVGGHCGFSGPITSDGRNRSTDVSCGFTNTAAGDAQNVDLLLGPLADNGGPTRTHAPQPGSPLLDAIPAGGCQAAGANGIIGDQRDEGRPAQGACDIGSVEVRTGVQTKTWVGPDDGPWSAPSNWSPLGVPRDGDSVVLGSSAQPRYDAGDVTIADLTMHGAFLGRSDGPGRLRIAGDVELLDAYNEIDAPIEVLAGSHVLHDTFGGRVNDLTGAGSLSITGVGSTIAADADFAGAVTIASGAGVLAPTGLGTAAGGTSLAPGATLDLAYTGASSLEPITALAGPGAPARLAVHGPGPSSRTQAGPVTLQGDLEVLRPATLSGAVSGPGRLTLGASTPGATGTSVLSGTVAVGSLLLPTDASVTGQVDTASIEVRAQLSVSGIDVLGDAPVTVTPTGSVVLLAGASLANPLSFTAPSTLSDPSAAALQLSDGSELSGAVDVGGTIFLRVAVAGDATISGPLTSDVTLDLQGSVLQPSHLLLRGDSELPETFITSLVVDVDDQGATQSFGTIQVIAAVASPVLGTFNFSATEQHDPATALQAGSNGLIDLWGTDQRASQVTLSSGSRLLLGLIDGGIDASLLRLTGGYVQQGGSEVDFVFGAGGSDQIRASSVTLAGDFTFFHDSTAAVGQVFRVIDNTGGAPVQGTWNGAPEGSTWFAGQQLFRLSYVGGTGNDVTFTRLPGVFSTWDFDAAIQHGGGMIGGPGLSSWGPGRVDGWISGLDRSVWHRWSQTGVGAQWENLGGTTLSTPAGVSQQPGQADVFIRGADNALWMRSYRNGWGPWTSLGGILTDAPSVTSPSPGNLAVTIRGADGAIWMRRMVANVWQPWFSLGGGTTATPAVTDWGDGRLDVFIRGLDGALWQRPIVNGVATPWLSQGGIVVDAPAVAAPGPDELAVFIRGADGNLWMKSWEGAGWSDWRNLELPISVRPGAAGVGQGELELGVRAPDGSLWTFHATSNDYVGTAGASSAADGTPIEGRGGVAPEAVLQPAAPRG